MGNELRNSSRFMNHTLANANDEVKQLLIYRLLNVRLNARMNLPDNRRRLLKELIAHKYGGSKKGFCDDVGISESRLSQLLSETYRGGEFGEKAARSLEEKAGLPPLYFEQSGPVMSGDVAVPYRGPERRATPDDSDYNASPEMELRPGRFVAIVGIGQGGPDGYISIDDYPAGQGDGEIFTYSPDPNAYAIRVRGDSMRPRIKSGEYIVAEPSNEAMPGDDVVVKLRSEKAMVKELLWQRDGEVSLGSINASVPPITIPLDEIVSIHRVAAIVPRGSALIRERK